MNYFNDNSPEKKMSLEDFLIKDLKRKIRDSKTLLSIFKGKEQKKKIKKRISGLEQELEGMVRIRKKEEIDEK